MLALKKIAVTGGIASGKSTVCRFFRELGAYVISADDIVHQLLIPQTALGKKVVALLGQDVVVGEAFSREAISQKVFRDLHLLKNLEQLIHPEVQRIIEAKYCQLVKENFPCTLFVVEVPLLFESGSEAFYDATILVSSDEKSCLDRFMKSTCYDAEEFERRTKRLLSMEEKQKKATFIIENNESIQQLKEVTHSLYSQLTRR